MEANEPAEVASPISCAPAGLGRDERCPLCGKSNNCRVAKGHLYKGLCWCDQIIVPSPVLHRLAAEWVERACLCRPCLETVAQIARVLDDPDAILTEIHRLIRGNTPVLASKDYYLDGNGNTVFTAAYHLKRGTCCHHQCRHCPY